MLPLVEQPLDVTTLSIVERHQGDETARFARIIVCYCGFQPFALRRRLAQLAAKPPLKRHAAHRIFTRAPVVAVREEPVASISWVAVRTSTGGNGTLPRKAPIV